MHPGEEQGGHVFAMSAAYWAGAMTSDDALIIQSNFNAVRLRLGAKTFGFQRLPLYPGVKDVPLAIIVLSTLERAVVNPLVNGVLV